MTLAVVLGGAASVWDELEAVRKLCTFDLLVAVNHAGRDFPGHVDHYATLHANLMPQWLEQRRAAGLSAPGTLWTALHNGKRLGGKVDLPFRVIDGSRGSSGLLGARVALEVADQAILCGIPMQADGEHFDRKGPWKEAEKYRSAWLERLDELRGRVKSMSGWTGEQFGVPTQEWLAPWANKQLIGA